jgi:hypothetical protein
MAAGKAERKPARPAQAARFGKEPVGGDDMHDKSKGRPQWVALVIYAAL